jgi:hypothetical protein
MKAANLSIALAVILSWSPAFSFIPPSSRLAHHPPLFRGACSVKLEGHHAQQPRQSSVLRMNLPAIVNTVQHPKIAACVLAFMILAVKMMRDPRAFFWHSAAMDNQCELDLPEGNLGCPFIGENVFLSATYMQLNSLVNG